LLFCKSDALDSFVFDLQEKDSVAKSNPDLHFNRAMASFLISLALSPSFSVLSFFFTPNSLSH
jgi:hypothetical protein